ncbi:MAG: hypothetical protein EAX81_06100 [Candidatus Thorarchaeota archaeon]|nr:hypothetical protein [Candidatus Thorarchaeota archaeon]
MLFGRWARWLAITVDLFEFKRGELFGSALPSSAEDLEELEEAGIDFVISLELISELPDFSELEIEHVTIPIPDFSSPSDENVIEFIRAVDRALKKRKTILVHCLGGCGRTGTMLALAEIYIYGERDGQTVINKVRSVRPCAIETEGQERTVMNHAKNPLKRLAGINKR